ncbi:MAG: hypothetical protein QOJ13_864 [Gaiellales bacterium]|jgi:hypothetical protein|nr:hypothetical protein [Gaiellales bacterium]
MRRLLAWFAPLIPSALAVTALISTSVAVAHGDKAPGLFAQVASVTPAQSGILVHVVGGDDRLKLTNRDRSDIVVYGYQGEPYLRWKDGVIYVNERSPATYLNEDRYGMAAVPAQADPKAAPRWKQVATGRTFAWHDHRIHWMSRQTPPAVANDPHNAQHIQDWTVPITVNGERVAIRGSLDYSPPEGVHGHVAGLLLRGGIAAGLAGLAGCALLMVSRRRARVATAEG